MGHSHPRPCRAHSQVPTLRPGDSRQCSPMPTFCQEQKLSVSESGDPVKLVCLGNHLLRPPPGNMSAQGSQGGLSRLPGPHARPALCPVPHSSQAAPVQRPNHNASDGSREADLTDWPPEWCLHIPEATNSRPAPSPSPPAPTFDSPSGSYLALDLTLLSGGELFRGAGCVRCPQCLATSMPHPPPSSAGGPTHSPGSPQMPFKPLGGAPTGSGSPPAPAPRALCTEHLLRAWPWAELMHSLSFPPNPVRQGKRPPISQMSRLRLREAMCLVPSLAATKCQSPK